MRRTFHPEQNLRPLTVITSAVLGALRRGVPRIFNLDANGGSRCAPSLAPAASRIRDRHFPRSLPRRRTQAPRSHASRWLVSKRPTRYTWHPSCDSRRGSGTPSRVSLDRDLRRCAFRLAMKSSHLLKIAAGASFCLGLFHVPFLFLGEEAARFFSAPPFVLEMVRSHSSWLWLVVAAILAVFGLFGAYALSAGGLIRRLPAVRGMLVAIAVIYTLRGLAVIPQVLLMLQRPGFVPPQVPVFSAVALLVGAIYWLGLRRLRQDAHAA